MYVRASENGASNMDSLKTRPIKKIILKGRAGGLVVSVLAF